VLTLPTWLGIKLEELFSSLNILKLDEDRSLKQLFVSATKANRVNRAVWCKESFNVELRARLLITKAFGIDGSYV
jgi:hypothetical protein